MKTRFRCSQLAQALTCPASVLVVPRAIAADKPRDTAAAVMGTWCHAAAAIELVANHGAIYDGAAPLAYPEYKTNNFARWIVRYYLQAINDLTHSDMALEVEAELVEELTPEIELSGHIDTLAITPDGFEAIIFDLKSGPNYVPSAADNAQILGYIVLLKKAYPMLRKATAYIVQPQNDPDAGFERVTEVVVDGAALDSSVAYVTRELQHAAANPRTFNSDGRHCGYCPAACRGCPAIDGDLEAMKLTLTKEKFEALKLNPDVTELARLELTAKKFTPIFDAAHDALKERLGDVPTEVDGVKFWIEMRPGKRTVTNNAAATEALRVLPDEKFHACYEFKPALIEDQLADHFQLPKASKKGPSGKSRYTDLLGGLTEQRVNKILKIA
jgi:hypothetical protein